MQFEGMRVKGGRSTVCNKAGMDRGGETGEEGESHVEVWKTQACIHCSVQNRADGVPLNEVRGFFSAMSLWSQKISLLRAFFFLSFFPLGVLISLLSLMRHLSCLFKPFILLQA